MNCLYILIRTDKAYFEQRSKENKYLLTFYLLIRTFNSNNVVIRTNSNSNKFKFPLNSNRFIADKRVRINRVKPVEYCETHPIEKG